MLGKPVADLASTTRKPRPGHPVWVLVGDTATAAKLVGLGDAERAGAEADTDVAARWLDDGKGPNGASGRALTTGSVHGFDLTFSAPKSVSLARGVAGGDVVDKAVAQAHSTAVREPMEYLAQHAGYTRVHNAATGSKDLARLPGLVAIAYQYETSRAGDPHLHTHVIVPNRQARADGKLVSLDGTSLYHDARAAGVIYQATLRRELHQLLGIEWGPADPHTGMAEIAGVDLETIRNWSQRATQLREWAAHNLKGAAAGRHEHPNPVRLRSQPPSDPAARRRQSGQLEQLVRQEHSDCRTTIRKLALD
jgi:conjugative relaxase-like TrwC/TraI family protein